MTDTVKQTKTIEDVVLGNKYNTTKYWEIKRNGGDPDESEVTEIEIPINPLYIIQDPKYYNTHGQYESFLEYFGKLEIKFDIKDTMDKNLNYRLKYLLKMKIKKQCLSF